jgi:Zn-dependent protease with chaperone function
VSPGARLGARAAIAVTLIGGFYVLIFAVLVALAFSLGLLVGLGGWAMLGALALYVLLIGVAAGLGRGLKAERFEPRGTRLLETDQPELWALVRDLAERVDTRPPDEIWLVTEVNAGVSEQTTWLGLRGGRRRLQLGVPVLMALTVEQLSAVVAHELGHYSHAHTRLVEINYRGHRAVAAAYVKLKRINPLRWLFAAYARLYFLVEAAVSRQQELEADQAAGRIAGRSAAQSALVETGVLSVAWDLYVGRHVMEVLPYGVAPARVFGGFPEFLRACEDDLVAIRVHVVEHETGTRWDSHPPLQERVVALAGAPEVGVYEDERPAWQLLASAESLIQNAEREAFDFGDRRLLDWPECMAEAVRVDAERRSDAMYRALSRITGNVPERLETLLVACERGELNDLRQQMDEVQAPEGGIGAAILTAALRGGATRVEHRFGGPPRVLLADGSELDTKELMAPLLEGGEAAAAKVRTALRAAGVDLALARTRQVRDDGAFAENLGAMPDVKLDGEWKDLIVTTDGLVFRPGPEKRSQDVGKKRLTKLLEETTAQRLIADPRNLWIPYEEMSSATVQREIPLHAEFRLYDGTAYELKEAIYGSPVGNARETLSRFLSALAS